LLKSVTTFAGKKIVQNGRSSCGTGERTPGFHGPQGGAAESASALTSHSRRTRHAATYNRELNRGKFRTAMRRYEYPALLRKAAPAKRLQSCRSDTARRFTARFMKRFALCEHARSHNDSVGTI
jgi:hypothetical protein